LPKISKFWKTLNFLCNIANLSIKKSEMKTEKSFFENYFLTSKWLLIFLLCETFLALIHPRGVFELTIGYYCPLVLRVRTRLVMSPLVTHQSRPKRKRCFEKIILDIGSFGHTQRWHYYVPTNTVWANTVISKSYFCSFPNILRIFTCPDNYQTWWQKF
jgi:hypothetical protein